MIHLYKNREFWEVLEQIRALCANKDGHSYIRVAFRQSYSEESYPPFFCKKVTSGDQVIEGDQFIQGDFIEIVDTK